MVQVSYPGVYIVEVPSGVHTITGVATSIAAFFGRATKGPLNKAVRILSVADHTRAFGKPHPLSDLAQSVRQFFDNGGTDGYVVRLAQGAQRAAVTLRNLADTQSVLTVTAKTEGLWGNGLRLEIDYNTPNPDDTFNMRVIYEDAGTVVSQEPPFTNLSMNPTSPRFAPAFVSQSSTLVDVALHADMEDPNITASFINTLANTPAGYSQGRRPFDTSPLATFQAELTNLLATNSRFDISVNGEQYVPVDLTGVDVTMGVLTLNGVSDESVAGRIAAVLNTQLGAAVAGLAVACQWDEIGAAGSNLHVLRITSASGNQSGVTVRRALANDLAGPLMLGLDQGGIEVARYSNMRPVFTGSAYVGGTAWGDFTNGIDDLAGVDQVVNGVTGITIAGSPQVNFVLPTAGANLWYESPAGGFDGVREKLRVIAQAVTANPAVGWRGEVWGYHLAFIRTGPGSINDTAAVTSAGNAVMGNGFVANNVRQYALGTIGRSTFQIEQPPGVFGIAGDDGIAPGVAEYLGDELLQTGFHALDSVDLFNLMVIPGDREFTAADHQQLWGPASIYCQSKRAFLLIDAPENWTHNGLLDRTAADVNQLRPGVITDHAAVFYPRVQYNDAGIRRYVGPSGIIAGLMARIDATRGVWKAPAGIEATLRGVLDLEVNLTDPENGILNKAGADCLRKFPSGLVNWGARTLAGFDDNSNTDWKYIPIRRLALFLEESLYRGTKWVVFEPNDEPLWAKIRMNINAFMMGLFRQGAFQGSTPDKAFFVKCDGETTTQNDRNLGIVNIEVGFAPLKPAEFVVIYIQQIAGDLT